jgi:SlyX protein
MKKNYNPELAHQSTPSVPSRWLWLLLAACVLVLFVGLLRALGPAKRVSTATSTYAARTGVSTGLAKVQTPRRMPRQSIAAPALNAEEIVASKVSQFARSRREIVQTIGRQLNQQVPPEVEKFFDAVEAGRWEEIKAQWDALAPRSGQYEHSTNHWAELNPFWPAVLDAYGVAEQAHLWPAQKLLDYGNAVLDSLRPGMVYVGGTDNGRWIPELLNETSGGEQHIIVTQNALADGRYLDFVNTQYSGSMTTLTAEDSQAAFQNYVADAQKRLEHDQQFPDEPKQVRPGEDIQMVDGKVQVSGQASVMAINDMLLQTLMQKNPGLSFAIQESFPFKDMYPDALPLGPLMELGSGDAQTQFNTERASRSLQYWQSTAQQVLSDPEAANSPDVLKAERKPRRALLDFGRLQSQNPRMPDENSQRIDKLESHLAHLEHQVEQLNGVVIEQGKLLDRLKKETQRQSGFMQTLELERTKSNVQKPPHYQ